MLKCVFSSYVFYYPIAISVIWTIDALHFWILNELRDKGALRNMRRFPNISILVPCHNEAQSIAATCKNLSYLDYPNYQVIFIDDASQDHTVEIIRPYVERYPFFHLISLKENLGKAGAA